MGIRTIALSEFLGMNVAVEKEFPPAAGVEPAGHIRGRGFYSTSYMLADGAQSSNQYTRKKKNDGDYDLVTLPLVP